MLSRLPETGAFPTAARTAMKSAVVFCQCALAWAACPAMAQSASQVLGRLDATAPAFRAATAGVIWIDHQAAIDMEDKQLGTMIVKRYSPTRLQYILHITDPDVYGVALRDNTIERYMPKINLIQVYDIRRYRDLAQKLMILGFGMTGRELADGFTISGISYETVETHRATRLDLIPKSADLLKQVSRIELWISDELGCALQQKLHFSGGDYKLVTFTDLKLNPKIDDTAMEFPKSAKREKVN